MALERHDRDIEATRQFVNRPEGEGSGVIPILPKRTITGTLCELQQIFIHIPGKKPALFTQDQIRSAFLDQDTSTLIVFTNQKKPRIREFLWDKENPAFYVITYLNPQTTSMTRIDNTVVAEEILSI